MADHVPAGQLVQLEALEAAEKVPAAHELHCPEPPKTVYFPAGHVTQEEGPMDPVRGFDEPCGHVMQEVDATAGW